MRPDLSAGSEGSSAPTRLADRLASIISYTLNPLLLPVAAFGIVTVWGGGSSAEVAAVFAVTGAFFMAIPLIVLLALLRMGRIETVEVRSRPRRIPPLSLGLLSFAAGTLLLHRIETPAVELLTLLAICLLINGFVALLITLRWKISIHASAAGGLLGLFIFLHLAPVLPPSYPSSAIWSAIAFAAVALPLVMWSRVRLRAHSPAQVIAGAGTGIILPLSELYFFWTTGILTSIP